MLTVVAYYLVDLYDDVLGDAGLFGSAIDHLCEVDALLVWLSDRHLAEYFILVGNYDADEITMQKTVDIHPPKTGISVHFSD